MPTVRTDFICIKGKRIDLNRVRFYLTQDDGVIVRFYYKNSSESFQFGSVEECSTIMNWIDKRMGITNISCTPTTQLLINGEKASE
jgi:hypothetical protein